MRFTTQEELRIAQFHSDNATVLDGTSNRPDAQKLKRDKWTELANKPNALNPGQKRSAEDVRKKWQNLKGKAKNKHAERKRSIMATGGGPSTDVKMTDAEEVIVDELCRTPQFNRVTGGIESSSKR